MESLSLSLPPSLSFSLSERPGEGAEEEEEGERGSLEGEGEGEEEGEGLLDEVGSHPFAAMTPDQDHERKKQLDHVRPLSEEELQQKK